MTATTPAAVVLWRVELPLINAHAASYGSVNVRDLILVEWTGADGSTGWGECPTFGEPGYVTETTDEAWVALSTDLVPVVMDQGISVLDCDLAATTGAVPRAALGALRDARLDAWLRSTGKSLVDHLGARQRPLRRTAVIASVGDSAGPIIDRANRAIAGGAELVKVKIAPGADLVILDPLVSAIGAENIAADANGSYSDPTVINRIDDLGLRYIEEPFSADLPWTERASLARGLTTPVALDESVLTSDDLELAAKYRACRIVSIKPAKVGGIEAAAAMIRHATALGLKPFVGGMVESAVGRAGALGVASLPAVSLPTDLGPSAAYFDHDISAPISVDSDGRIKAPDGPGNGRVPDIDRLIELATDRIEILNG